MTIHRSCARAGGDVFVVFGTPVERCIRNLAARRRAGRHWWSTMAPAVAADHEAVAAASGRLRAFADIETLLIEDALARARELLGRGRLSQPRQVPSEEHSGRSPRPRTTAEIFGRIRLLLRPSEQDGRVREATSIVRERRDALTECPG